MRLVLSDHARKRMFERGISLDEIVEVVRRGRKWREGDTVHATKRDVEVVYRVIGSNIYVITVYHR